MFNIWDNQIIKSLWKLGGLIKSTFDGVLRTVVARPQGEDNVDAFDLAIAFLKIPNQHIPPILGDVPVDLVESPPTTHPTEARPRLEQSVQTWTRELQIPLVDYIIQKPPGSYPARIPRGTVLKTLLNGFRTSNLSDNREGQQDEYYAFSMLVESNHVTWRLGRTLGETNESSPATGLDAMLQSLLDGGLPPELRAFATSTGLRSYLTEGPNELVSAMNTLT